MIVNLIIEISKIKIKLNVDDWCNIDEIRDRYQYEIIEKVAESLSIDNINDIDFVESMYII